MLQQISGQLSEAIEKKKRKQKLERDLHSVETELQERTGRLAELEKELAKEQIDVEKLERTSLTKLFYTVLGSREEQQEKERQEMLAAQLRYTQTKRQVEFLQRDRDYILRQLEELANADAEYETLLAEKERWLRDSDDAIAGQLVELAEQIAGADVEIKEITEAVAAGQMVISGLDAVIKSLESAEGWGTWDMLGGDFLATAVKHSKIDDARKGINDVQNKISRFTRELADVQQNADIRIDIDEFTYLADFFIDGLIVDWVVQSRIQDSKKQAVDARRKIVHVVNELKEVKKTARKQGSRLQEQRTRIIEQT